MGPNPFVFLVGCPRSGTTLLRRMLDAHPDLAMTRETHWIPQLFDQCVRLDGGGALTKELVQALSRHRKFTRLGITLNELAELADGEREVIYSDFVSRIFDLYGRKQGKALVGDKTPGYVRKIPALNRLWPSARHVQLIRDGRDVCLSVLDWERAKRTVGRFSTWIEDPISTTALWWEWNVRLGREAGERLLPGLYSEILYENLVSHPERACAELCAFLGLVSDDAMVRYHEGRTRTKSGIDSKHAWLPPTPGLRDWRRELELADLERFEAVAGRLLKELDYERAVPHPSRDALETVSRVRETFIDELRARKRPVPRHWQACSEKAEAR